MATDILEVVALDEIPELLKIFKKDWPKFYPLDQYVTILSENKKRKLEVPKQTLYRHGDVENGVYLIESDFSIEEDVKLTFYFIYTISSDLSDLRNSLMKTSRIPWANKGFIFEVTLDRFVPVLTEVVRAKGVEFDATENYMFWLPEPVSCGTVPEDMYITNLEESHLREVNENWPHRFPGSEIFLSHQLSNNFGLGLFRKVDKKLACSALSFHLGGIFVLYTDPELRGKGYADIIVRSMSNELHKRGRIPFATILLENIPSQKLFEKIGFKLFTKIHFVWSI